MAENPGFAAIWVPKQTAVKAKTPALLENMGFSKRSILVLSSFRATSVAFSEYQEVDAPGKRQSVAIENARLHVIGKGRSLDMCALLQDGDINGDGKVNVVDVQSVIIAQTWGTPTVGAHGDLDCDGEITVVDVLLSIQYALQAM
ncbi:MAG: dockerin type I repeat-containing protein [Myxococcota bacterium]|nr:dockerin type I repeat-containing protein [Myxococcota bacterium]